ncbi:MAG TPA: acyl carrier protein [Reyranella sp.]|nr:acyl carrier protein [Reyranella sp.]
MQIARNLAPDTRGAINVLERERITLRDDVMYEVCRQLAPYRADDKPITAQTVIYDDLSIDSLAVMDIVVELEDRFDIAIPINTVAEIRTVKELADAILALARR